MIFSVLKSERGTSQRPGAPILMRNILRDICSMERLSGVMSAPSSGWVPCSSTRLPVCTLPAATDLSPLFVVRMLSALTGHSIACKQHLD